MNERKNRSLAWGMLLGMSIGSSIATMMYAETGEPFYFGLIGVGLAFGLGLGAAFDKERRST
jgi:hypothetical protein